MDPINIVLIAIIGYVIYSFMTSSINDQPKSNNNSEGQINNNGVNKKGRKRKKNRRREKFTTDRDNYAFDNNVYADDILDDVVSWDESYDYGHITKEEVNPNFLNIQWHNDYRDVITAFNNLVPKKKQLFNLPNIPIVYSEPEAAEVKNMVSDFVAVLNENIKKEIPSYRNPNSGWDEAIPDPKIKSGWDKVQESLGLPTSLYEEPAGKSLIKIISINLVQKYETEDEVKYSIEIVLQKVDIDDQILIKADFVQDKRPLHDENNFFKTSTIEMKVTIENIFILGFLSKYGNDDINQFDNDEEKFYDYNKLEYNNMTDPKFVQKILMEKYRQRTEQMEQRNAMLDEEGQNFHRELPHVYDFSNIKGTQTIFDDMNYHKTFT